MKHISDALIEGKTNGVTYKNRLGLKVKLGTNVLAYLSVVSGDKNKSQPQYKLPHKIYCRD